MSYKIPIRTPTSEIETKFRPNLRRRNSYTLNDLEKNEEFQEVSERFLQSIGENSGDIFEYLRDSDWNLYSGMRRASQSGKWTEQQKQDYAYLRSAFDGADIGSFGQFLELTKDAGIDILTDPLTIAAAVATPFTGGISLAARSGINLAASAALKSSIKGASQKVPHLVNLMDRTLQTQAANKFINVSKSQINKITGTTAAIGGTWTGLDNYFRQNTELNTDLRQAFSAPELFGATALGAVAGGVFGRLGQQNVLYNSRMARLFSNDDYRRIAPNFFKVRKGIDTMLSKFGGNAASFLNTIAEASPTATKLGQTFVDDFEKKLLGPSVTRRLGYSYAEDLDNRRGGYLMGLDAALEPIRKTGKVLEVDGLATIRILRGAKVTKKNKKLFINFKGDDIEISKEALISATRLRKIFDSVYKHADKAGLKPTYIDDWFARSWNRQAIEADPEGFKKLLTQERTRRGTDGVEQKFRIVDPKEVDEVIEGMLDKTDELYASHSHLFSQSRVFKDLPDNEFEKFLTNDLAEISVDYLLHSARTIEIKNKFLLPTVSNKTPEEQFIERWINPIRKEMKEAGQTLTKNDQKKILKLFNSVAGVQSYFGDTVQRLYDGMKLANAMAYLPLATLSSITEAIIPFAKAKMSSATKGTFDAVTKSHKIFGTEMTQMLRNKHKLSNDSIIREMNSQFIGMSEAVGNVTNRLAGEGLQNEFLKKGATGFFRFNLLIPWTKTVQLQSFSTGKDLIFDNLTKLSKISKEGVDVLDDFALMSKALQGVDKKSRIAGLLEGLSASAGKTNLKKIDYLKSELFELGIDVAEGLKWIERGAKQSDNFYKQVVRGAGRFTNSVILQTGRERAKVPTYMTNPKWDILTQFLRYPYVFSNTVLKNFARDVIKNPKANAPKVAAFGVLSTNIALATNYWRSSPEYRERIDKEGFTHKDVVRALQRTGMAGPLDLGIRWGESAKYGRNSFVAATSLGGPVVGDIVNGFLYERGIVETAARKMPLYGSKNIIKRYTGFDMDKVVKRAKEIDEPFEKALDEALENWSLTKERKFNY